MILQVTVKPNARRPRLERLNDGSWRAYVKSPPVEGRANAELTALLAEHFDIPQSAVTIEHGARGRRKLVRLATEGAPLRDPAARRGADAPQSGSKH